MTQEETSNAMISLQEVRRFIESSNSRIIPEKVAEMLTERTLIPGDSEELQALFTPLIHNLKERLSERGIRLPIRIKQSHKLSAKEQRMIGSLCILQAGVADSLARSGYGQPGETIAYARQAQESCRLAKNYQMVTAAIDIEAAKMRDGGDNVGALKKQQESYRIGLAQNDQEIIRRSLYNQSATLRTLGRYAEAIEMLHKVIEIEGDHPVDRAVKGMAYNQLAWVLMTIEDKAGAYEATCSGLELVTDFPSTQINLLITQAHVHKAKEEYLSAFEAAKKGLKIARKCGEKAHIATLLVTFGEIHAMLGDIAEAKSAYEEAIAIFDTLDFILHKEQTTISLATLLTKHGEHQRALDIYHTLLAENQQWHSAPRRYARVLSSAAELYTVLERFDEAEEMFLEALNLHTNVAIPQGTSETLLKLGKLYVEQGEEEKAIEIYKQVLDQLDMETSKATGIEASRELTKLYENRGEAAKELRYYKIYHQLSMKAKDALLDDKLNYLRIQHKVERHRTEVEYERLRREKIEVELQETTIALVERSELIGSLRKKVRGILRDLDGDQLPILGNALQQIIREVTNTSQANQKAVLLLHSVNDTFYTELRHRHPNLTPGQIKLCGFIRAGMDKQDIMTLLHISLGSLNKQRYRLRGRLGLKRKESLENYLAEIG